MDITFNIDRKKVYHEIEQTTSYVGAKTEGDDNAYQRIRTTDEDSTQLLRFFDEARQEVANALVRFFKEEKMEGDIYSLVLCVSDDFDESLQPGMESSLFSYLTVSVIAKWFAITNKEEAAAYAERGAALLDDMRKKAFHKKKPERPVYNN